MTMRSCFLILCTLGFLLQLPSEEITIDVLEMSNGQTLRGHYDAEAGSIELISKRTGKSVGSSVVNPDFIIAQSSETIAVESQPQRGAKRGPPPGLNGQWITDFTQARQLAQKHNTPILLDFTGSDWCGWCIKLDEEVFDTKAFQQWAAKRIVLVKLDYPRRTKQDPQLKKQNEALQKHYQIRGFPTVLIIDPAGKVLRRYGYAKGGFKAWLDGLLANTRGLESLAP